MRIRLPGWFRGHLGLTTGVSVLTSDVGPLEPHVADACAGTAERPVSKVHWGRVLAGGEAQDRAFGDILRDLEGALRGVARERRETAAAATAILARSSRGTPEEGDEAA
jgi:hypothetical protein